MGGPSKHTSIEEFIKNFPIYKKEIISLKYDKKIIDFFNTTLKQIIIKANQVNPSIQYIIYTENLPILTNDDKFGEKIFKMLKKSLATFVLTIIKEDYDSKYNRNNLYSRNIFRRDFIPVDNQIYNLYGPSSLRKNLHYIKSNNNLSRPEIKTIEIETDNNNDLYLGSDIRELGRGRYNTKLVRNLEWFVNLQRFMRLVINDTIKWIDEPVIKGDKGYMKKITEYENNEKYKKNEYM